MSLNSPAKNLSFILIAAAALILCFVNLGGYPIYILDEAKNAEAAREMFVNREWILPLYNGELRTDKPVLHYWFMIIAYKIFGVSAFSARFFSAVLGVATLLCTFHFVRKLSGGQMARTTLIVLLSAIFFIQEFHLAVPDPYLIFFMSLGLFQFYNFYKFRKTSSLFIAYASLGLGLLAKGPVAVLLPALILLIFLISIRKFKFKEIFQFRPFLGLLIILAISLPWFYLVHSATGGEFTEGFFLHHNFSRFGSEMEGHGGLPFVTWLFVLLGLLPFSFFVIQSFVSGWRQRKENEFIWFSFVVSAVIIVFFSISATKLPNYTMPAFPFLAVLTAAYLEKLIHSGSRLKGYKISLWVLFAVAILLPVGGYIALTHFETALFPARFYSLLLLVFPLGILGALISVSKNQIRKSILYTAAGGILVSLCLFIWIYPALVRQSPLSLSHNVMERDTPAILYKGYDPAFLFNYEKTFPFADNKEAVFEFLDKFPDGIIITKDKFFQSEWADEDAEILMQQKALFENYTVTIFKLK